MPEELQPQPVQQPAQVTVIAQPQGNYTIDEVVRITRAIQETITKGFEGVHKRQDETNGKVIASKTWIDENKEFIADLKEEHRDNYKRFVDLAWKIVVILAISALTIIGTVLGIKNIM